MVITVFSTLTHLEVAISRMFWSQTGRIEHIKVPMPTPFEQVIADPEMSVAVACGVAMCVVEGQTLPNLAAELCWRVCDLHRVLERCLNPERYEAVRKYQITFEQLGFDSDEVRTFFRAAGLNVKVVDSLVPENMGRIAELAQRPKYVRDVHNYTAGH